MRHKSLIFSFVSFLFLVVTLIWQLKYRTSAPREFKFKDDNLEIYFKSKFNFTKFNNSLKTSSPEVEEQAVNETREKIFHHRFQRSDEANLADSKGIS